MSDPITMSVWNQALDEWGDGPRTMAGTAAWANRWVHELRTASERDSIEIAALRARVDASEARVKVLERDKALMRRALEQVYAERCGNAMPCGCKTSCIHTSELIFAALSAPSGEVTK